MTILGIETATAVCGVAIVTDGIVRAELRMEAPHIHSEKLMTLIDEASRSSKIAVDCFDGIAVSIGPGSFTGLRIGLSVAKGLSFGLDKPILAVPTLEALALSVAMSGRFNRSDDAVILPLLDARRDEVYCAMYSFRKETLEEILAPCALRVGEIEHHCVSHSSSIIVTGDGAKKLHDYITTSSMKIAPRYNFPARHEETLCSPLAVALIGERTLRTGKVSDGITLEPMYVKEFQTIVKTHHLEVQP